MLHPDSRTPTQNIFKVTARTSNGPLIVVFPPTPPSTHTIRAEDIPYLDPHISEHDPSNAQPKSELTSAVSSRTAKNSSILTESSGSGGEHDPESLSTILASPGKGFVSTSSFSFSRSSPLRPILRFDGQTSHGPAFVELPPTFEGYFALRTSNRHQPRVVAKRREGSNKATEDDSGPDLVREVTDELLEGGEVVKGTIRLVPAESNESKSSEKHPADTNASPKGNGDEGQSPTPSIPSNEDGTVNIPVAWANVWTTDDRIELWV